jgi:hypothetical protein
LEKATRNIETLGRKFTVGLGVDSDVGCIAEGFGIKLRVGLAVVDVRRVGALLLPLGSSLGDDVIVGRY